MRESEIVRERERDTERSESEREGERKTASENDRRGVSESEWERTIWEREKEVSESDRDI